MSKHTDNLQPTNETLQNSHNYYIKSNYNTLSPMHTGKPRHTGSDICEINGLKHTGQEKQTNSYQQPKQTGEYTMLNHTGIITNGQITNVSNKQNSNVSNRQSVMQHEHQEKLCHTDVVRYSNIDYNYTSKSTPHIGVEEIYPKAMCIKQKNPTNSGLQNQETVSLPGSIDYQEEQAKNAYYIESMDNLHGITKTSTVTHKLNSPKECGQKNINIPETGTYPKQKQTEVCKQDSMADCDDMRSAYEGQLIAKQLPYTEPAPAHLSKQTHVGGPQNSAEMERISTDFTKEKAQQSNLMDQSISSICLDMDYSENDYQTQQFMEKMASQMEMTQAYINRAYAAIARGSKANNVPVEIMKTDTYDTKAISIQNKDSIPIYNTSKHETHSIIDIKAKYGVDFQKIKDTCNNKKDIKL